MLMHQLLIESAARRPDAIAFRWIDRNVALTYEQACAMMENMAGGGSVPGCGQGGGGEVICPYNGGGLSVDSLAARLGALWVLGHG